MGGVGVEPDICQGCEMQGCGAWKLLEEEEQACCFDLFLLLLVLQPRR